MSFCVTTGNCYSRAVTVKGQGIGTRRQGEVTEVIANGLSLWVGCSYSAREGWCPFYSCLASTYAYLVVAASSIQAQMLLADTNPQH